MNVTLHLLNEITLEACDFADVGWLQFREKSNANVDIIFRPREDLEALQRFVNDLEAACVVMRGMLPKVAVSSTEPPLSDEELEKALFKARERIVADKLDDDIPF